MFLWVVQRSCLQTLGQSESLISLLLSSLRRHLTSVKTFFFRTFEKAVFIFLFCFKSIWLGKCNKDINDILWINLWSRLFKSFIDNSYPDSLGCQIVNLVLDWEGTWTWIWIGKERTDLKQYQFLHSLKLSPLANNPTPLTLIKAKN